MGVMQNIVPVVIDKGVSHDSDSPGFQISGIYKFIPAQERFQISFLNKISCIIGS
jgi:hypothetical protein